MKVRTFHLSQQFFLGSQAKLGQDFHALVALVQHCQVDGSIAVVIRLVHRSACLCVLGQHLMQVIESRPSNQLLLLDIHVTRPIGDICSLNRPVVHSSLIDGSLFLQQVHVFPLAVHASDVQRRMSEVRRLVQNGISVWQSIEIERDVRRVVRAHVGECSCATRVHLRFQLILQQKKSSEAAIHILLLQIDMPDPVLKTRLVVRDRPA